jgi:polyisoprenoid-binding protein YceI
MKLHRGLIVMGVLLAAPAAAAPETYVIDLPHSFSNFEVGYLGVTSIRGRFNKTTGTITLDRVGKTGSIEAQIDVTTVDTGYARRDELLRTENYFNAAEYPTMTFRSKNLRFNGDDLAGADGELTLLGVTRPVSVELVSLKCITHPTNKRETCGAIATGTIRRSDFGMTRASRSIGDDIRVFINVFAYKN